MVARSHHASQRAIDAPRLFGALIMRVEGKFLQSGIVALEAESRADDGMASAAIEEVFGFDVFDGLRRSTDFEPLPARLQGNVIDGYFLAHIRTAFPGMIEQNLVELGAFNLQGGRALRAKAVLEIEADFGASAVRGDFGAVFAHKSGCFKLRHEAKTLESLHAEGQERLADMKARKLLAFEYGDLMPREGQRGSGDASGRPTAYDRDVIECVRHLVRVGGY